MTLLANTESHSRSVLLKGEAADRAERVEFVERLDSGIEPTGHWAEDRDAARRSGFSEGREAGRRAGEKLANDDAAVTASRAVAALDNLMEAMHTREVALGEELSEQVTSLALTVAEAVLARELAVTTDPGREAIVRCMATAPEGGNVVAKLHPADIERLGHLDTILEGRPVTVVPDSSLASGDSVVTVGDTRIDGRLSEAMDRVREVLR